MAQKMSKQLWVNCKLLKLPSILTVTHSMLGKSQSYTRTSTFSANSLDHILPTIILEEMVSCRSHGSDVAATQTAVMIKPALEPVMMPVHFPPHEWIVTVCNPGTMLAADLWLSLSAIREVHHPGTMLAADLWLSLSAIREVRHPGTMLAADLWLSPSAIREVRHPGTMLAADLWLSPSAIREVRHPGTMIAADLWLSPSAIREVRHPGTMIAADLWLSPSAIREVRHPGTMLAADLWFLPRGHWKSSCMLSIRQVLEWPDYALHTAFHLSSIWIWGHS